METVAQMDETMDKDFNEHAITHSDVTLLRRYLRGPPKIFQGRVIFEF